MTPSMYTLIGKQSEPLLCCNSLCSLHYATGAYSQQLYEYHLYFNQLTLLIYICIQLRFLICHVLVLSQKHVYNSGSSSERMETLSQIRKCHCQIWLPPEEIVDHIDTYISGYNELLLPETHQTNIQVISLYRLLNKLGGGEA